MKRLLCRVGLHRWFDTGMIGSMLLPATLDRCRQCGVLRMFVGFCYVLYEPGPGWPPVEQMLAERERA